ncbi:MAG: Mur ligase family protein, partial [Sphaerochaetaceae bacterium]
GKWTTSWSFSARFVCQSLVVIKSDDYYAHIMRILIFGLGILGGGFASANYFLDRGHEVRITDLRSEEALGGSLELLKKRGATVVCTEHRVEDFVWADIVIKNPAVSPDSPFLTYAKRIESDISFVFASPITNSIKIIAVTGTKGKTTTVAATTHILNMLGHEAIQFGNMGISGFSILANLESRLHKGKALPEYLVCELSSWQIRDLYAILGKAVPRFKVVALTSIFHDHLNRYTDFQSYKEDKWLLFGAQNTRLLVPQSVYEEVSGIAGIRQKNITIIESIAGATQQEARIRVAWSICRSLRFGTKQIGKALETFRGVPHRQEQVGIKNHVVFINDSSATIPEAAAFSCATCPWNYQLICGGTDKNLQAEGMVQALKEAKGIHVLAGSFTADKLIPLLEKEHLAFSGPFDSMQAVFDSAYAAALEDLALQDNVAVILSPGAASFGMFRHEFDRGDQFRALVDNLEE